MPSGGSHYLGFHIQDRRNSAGPVVKLEVVRSCSTLHNEFFNR